MTDLEAANLALAAVGAETIRTLADPTKAARIANSYLPVARNAVLRAYPWRAARRRAQLTTLPGIPDNLTDYSQAFGLPADLIAPVSLASGADYEIEGGVLYTDEEPTSDTDGLGVVTVTNPILSYTAAPPNLSPLPDDLGMAVAYNLAIMVAPHLSGQAQAIPQLVALYDEAKRRAIASDARGGSPEPADKTLWVDVS